MTGMAKDDVQEDKRWIRAQEHMNDYVHQVASSTAHNRSSMLRDVEQRRPTEIDFINGYIAQLGQAHRVNASLNLHLWMMLKAHEYESSHVGGSAFNAKSNPR